jgi:hypothetical protein
MHLQAASSSTDLLSPLVHAGKFGGLSRSALAEGTEPAPLCLLDFPSVTDDRVVRAVGCIVSSHGAGLLQLHGLGAQRLLLAAARCSMLPDTAAVPTMCQDLQLSVTAKVSS